MFLRILYIGIGLFAAYLCVQIYLTSATLSALDDVTYDYAYGSQNPDLSVVEFFDYSCPYCRQAHPLITDAIDLDGKAILIPRPLPSQNRTALKAAYMVYAAGMQGEFWAMHQKLIENFEILENAEMSSFISGLGLDEEQFMQDVQSEAIANVLNENARLFQSIGAKATPTFIIGGKIIFVPEGQMPTPQDFLDMFNEARGYVL